MNRPDELRQKKPSIKNDNASPSYNMLVDVEVKRLLPGVAGERKSQYMPLSEGHICKIAGLRGSRTSSAESGRVRFRGSRVSSRVYEHGIWARLPRLCETY
ncbi:hypothetical protein MTO96_032538 [Rhipicephalus appendiculatus]